MLMAANDNVNEGLILNLPDHLVLLCLTRVPISNFRSMSRVCRAWQKMLRKRDFWNVRRDLSATEELCFFCTLVALRGPSDTHSKDVTVWHAFDPSSDNLFRLPAMPEDGRAPGSSAFAAVDGKLFVIGGELHNSGISCRTVSYFDAREYCWKMSAWLNIARSNCKARVIDNKLYVFGGFTSDFASAEGGQDVTTYTTPLRTAEIYDPVTKSWTLVSDMKIPVQIDYSAVMNGKFLAISTSGKDLQSIRARTYDWTTMADVMGVIYDPQTSEWTNMAHGLMHGWRRKTVEVKGRLYTAHLFTYIQFYDSSKDSWKEVQIGAESSQCGEGWCWDLDSSLLGFGSSFLGFGWTFELLNFRGKLCVIGLQALTQRAFMMVLDMEEHLSKDNDIIVVGHILIVKDITNEIKVSGFPSRLSCQVTDV